MSEAVSVVICAHDERRWRQLQTALASVEKQDRRPLETVVVIDHNPAFFARVRRDLPGATVVENFGPRGLGGARNQGVEMSSGSIVAFLDDDAVASRQWLTVVGEWYADSAVAGVGGGIEPLWELGRPDWFPAEFEWVVGCSYRGMPKVAQEVRNLFGCNMSFRRDVLRALGGFRLGYGCDETELCIRLRQRWPWRKLVYVPNGKVFHLVPSERANLRYFLARCFFEGGSKAVVSALVGSRTGLSCERRYAREILPEGLALGVRDFVRQRDVNGLARSATILAGLTSTSIGYVTGLLSTSRAAHRRGWCGDAPVSSGRRPVEAQR